MRRRGKRKTSADKVYIQDWMTGTAAFLPKSESVIKSIRKEPYIWFVNRFEHPDDFGEVFPNITMVDRALLEE